MRYRIRVVGVVALSLVASILCAEQEVVLKSGTVLVGKVSIDGETVVVQVGDAPLKMPLKEVAGITAADSSKEHQARRLLLTALEAKLTHDAGKEVIGILAEAARLAPDDPHIAYWYATSLADAGFGQAARDALERRREQIAAAYPGMADQLAKRIDERVAMEKLPPALIERLDALNTAVAAQPANNEMRQWCAMFRLIDQDERPIERSAFRIQANGQDEKLESFGDGYYLYTFNLHRSNDERPCSIEVLRPGLEASTFEFSPATNRVEDAGDFKVRRYEEDAKKSLKLRVVGQDGKPIPGAHVSLQAKSPRGGGSVFTRSADTDIEGIAEFQAFPLTYSYTVHAEGFNFQSADVEVKADATEPVERQIELYRAITGTIRVAWSATSMQGGGKTTGEATIRVSGQPAQPAMYGPDATPWIKPLQKKDQLVLQFIDTPFGYMGPFGGNDAWLRVVEPSVDADDEKAEAGLREKFASIDLNKIDGLKDDLPEPDTGLNPGQRGPMVVPAELGKVYVGKLMNRDMRTGQPVQLAIKAMVEKMESEAPTEE